MCFAVTLCEDAVALVPIGRTTATAIKHRTARRITPPVSHHEHTVKSLTELARSPRLEHEQPNRFRQCRGQAAGVANFAAGDKEAHRRRAVLSVSDRDARSGS